MARAGLLAAWSWLSALLCLGVTAALLGFLAWRGGHTVGPGLFFGEATAWDAVVRGAPVWDGIWPACLGTLWLVGLTSMVAIPLGLATGVYLSEYARGGRRAVLGFGVDLLAGIPSIVMGLFGFALILFLRRSFAPRANTCLLLSACCMALLVLPYLINATRTALAGLPESLRLTGPCLGLGKWQNIRRVLLPAAGPGILGGVILAVGRAAEDTAVILLTGVVANAGSPAGLTGKYEALPFHIFYLAAEHQNPAELDRGFGAALVLLCLTAALFLGARALHAGLERRWKRS